MNPTPETKMSPEREYIHAQIRTQVQAQSLAQTQAHILSQAHSLETPNSQYPFQNSSSSLTNRIRLPDSAKFDGKVSEYTFFISSMEIFFWGSPETFELDKNKILFVGTHLLGTASTLFRSLISANSPCLENFELLMQEFKNNFSDPSHTIKARVK
ncbi:hypothetical protein AYI69_g7097 [Smittium culicis]|uniref:DUF4939 domain-containing protein n=1 Tax=Smittium culicis TaxID=133412 RepID=A0A1R1XUJ7_9FUNG|nr:hypothetical protein AYI69_g7097 [Smittium culicis]